MDKCVVKTKKQKINRGRSNTGQFLPKKYTWCYVTPSGRRKKNKNGNYVEWNGKAGKKREKTRPKAKSTKRAHSAKKPKV